MVSQGQSDYYVSRKPEILEGFDQAAEQWRPVLSSRFGDGFADAVLREAREQFEALLPGIPYIGGEENPLTSSLIGSVRCLAFYQAMRARGKSSRETGHILYDAVRTGAGDPVPPIPPSEKLSREELMRRRRERADRSLERKYAWDWVFEFVEGDGESFDYGYNFLECATEKFYRAQGAEEFLPYYCFLDFPECELAGLGLSRATTLAEGYDRCDFRFTEGGKSDQEWPPRFLKRDQESRSISG